MSFNNRLIELRQKEGERNLPNCHQMNWVGDTRKKPSRFWQNRRKFDIRPIATLCQSFILQSLHGNFSTKTKSSTEQNGKKTKKKNEKKVCFVRMLETKEPYFPGTPPHHILSLPKNSPYPPQWIFGASGATFRRMMT